MKMKEIGPRGRVPGAPLIRQCEIFNGAIRLGHNFNIRTTHVDLHDYIGSLVFNTLFHLFL